MGSERGPSRSDDDLGYRRRARSVGDRFEETSLFGSPEPAAVGNKYSYRGPKSADRRNMRAFYNDSVMKDYSRPGSTLSSYSGIDSTSGYTPVYSGIRERDVTRFDSDPELTPTNGSRPPSRYSVRSVSADLEEELDDKYLEYRRRHFTEEGERKMKEKKNRLPVYNNDLLHSFQRSYNRQADLVPQADAPAKPRRRRISSDPEERKENLWDIFPTVEDLDGCYLVEKQFEVAIDPHSEFPDMTDWMGLFHGEDGVYTLNKGLSQNPITGKSQANKVYRLRDGVKMLVVYRPPKPAKQTTFGFKITVMDNGVYVTHIRSEGPAVRAGLRYGDQVLRVGQKYCSGLLQAQVEDMIAKSGDEMILFVRDRPNEKMYTLLRDSHGYFGFRIRSAEVVEVMPGSSASRNGIPTNHFITEINGQNVVGWDDDKIRRQMEAASADGAVTFTMVHERAYKDLVKDLGAALLGSMDHSLNISFPVPRFEFDTDSWNPSSILHTVTEKTSIEN